MSKCVAFIVGGIVFGLAPVFLWLTCANWKSAVDTAHSDSGTHREVEEDYGNGCLFFAFFWVTLIIGIVFLSMGCCCLNESKEQSSDSATTVVITSSNQSSAMPSTSAASQ
jgi:hypothetical protein